MPLRNVTRNATNIKLDGRNRTGTHLSTNIVIAVAGTPVGAVKSLRIQESRDIQQWSEVGTDGVIDSAPGSSAKYSGSCTRIRFDGKRIAEAFGRGFLHVGAQRVPFDIEIYDFIRGDENQIVITTIENVWIESISYAYDSENFLISDEMNWKAETINSVMNQTTDTAISDIRSVFLNTFEKQADTGLYRGALDAAGLINAFQGGLGQEVAL